jgi:hypothetical protein
MAGNLACPSRGRSAFDSDGRSRQPNTHSTELRELRYPWHPWFGRAVAVYEVLVKQGHSVSRCGLEEERNRLSIEVPTWMFEPAACDRLRVTAVPTVNCDALRALQTLLRTTAHPDPDDVPEAQHRSLPAAGGADAPLRDPTETLATHAVSSPSLASVVSDVPPEIQEKTIRLLARLLRGHVHSIWTPGAATSARLVLDAPPASVLVTS